MTQGLGLLSVLVWLPILGGLAVLALGDRQAGLARWLALGVSVLTFALSVPSNGLLRKEFEIENVATGVYGVIVTIGNEVWSEKVVIQR